MRAIMLLCFVGFALSPESIAHRADRLVGTWSLVSASASTATDTDDAPFGAGPTGLLIYTPEGRMSAMISYGGRKPLSGADRIAAPAVERAEAFATFFSYGGRYSMDGDNVIHHVEISSVQNWVNTDLVRVIRFDGDRITLRTPPLSVGGVTRTTELVFERIH